MELVQFESDLLLATAAAKACVARIQAVPLGRKFCLALSGGRIAQRFFSAFAAATHEVGANLSNVHFFWADERCVPPADPESNFGIAQRLLLTPLEIPTGQIHRVPGEQPPPTAAALAAEELLRIVPERAEGQPVLDLVLLGMGEDGHVASLFPGESVRVMEDPGVYRAVTATKPPPQRITMGYPVLRAARQVWVLASGAGKEAALRDSVGADGTTPLARVVRSRTGTRVFTDLSSG